MAKALNANEKIKFNLEKSVIKVATDRSRTHWQIDEFRKAVVKDGINNFKCDQ